MTKVKPKVIIADDEVHCRALLKAILSSMNCEVICEARNGVETVELYSQFQPHLLLLDINMPLKTGEQVLEEIIARHPDAFVIMLTSVADREHVQKCLNLGAANYIRKDTPIAEIKTIIRDTWQSFMSKRVKATKQEG